MCVGTSWRLVGILCGGDGTEGAVTVILSPGTRSTPAAATSARERPGLARLVKHQIRLLKLYT